MFDLLRVLLYTLLYTLLFILLFIFFLISIPFVVAHVAEHWDAPIYPHSGFTPDCPSWETPENTLPPTYNLASGDEF